jgi:glyoxylase-like metal-dependent hydrolase (beta-lactamase superfamily II)
LVQISPHVHALRIPFQIPVGPGVTLDRFVYAYALYGRHITLVDAGVAGYRDSLFAYLRDTGRSPDEIKLIVLTHAHPDHIGGALRIQKATGCRIAAHAGDVAWIEDVDRQVRERPVPGFHSLVEGSVKVDLTLEDGACLDLAEGATLRVLHTPGHAAGHIALSYPADQALFSGDAIPLPATAPIYDDVPAAMRSIERLLEVEGVHRLYSSWDEPRDAEQVRGTIQAGLAWIRRVQDVVCELRDPSGDPVRDAPILAPQVLAALGLPPSAMNPLFARTVAAHLRAASTGIA